VGVHGLPIVRNGRSAVSVALRGGVLLAALLWAWPAAAQSLRVATRETAPAAESQARLEDLSRAFRAVTQAARPSVVHLRVRGGELDDTELEESLRELREALPQVPEGQLRQWLRRAPAGSGSGVIFDADGHIVTNDHVVAQRAEIEVVLADERTFTARLVGRDPKTDLAVLRIDATDLQPLPFGDSDAVDVGDWVLAVGAPFGLANTVTHGIISARGRTQVPGVSIDYQDFLQTDAAINPGNSGGPLLNLRGEVIGINTAIATRGEGVNAGVAFTIPSNMVRRIVGQLISSGGVARGWLGVSMSELTRDDAEIFGIRPAGGVIIEGVLADTPAARSGMQVEDVLVRIDDRPIRDVNHVRNLIAEMSPGTKIRLALVRGGEARDLEITLEEQPENTRRVGGVMRARAISALGVQVLTLRPAIGQVLGFAADARGVVVDRVDTGAAGSAAGLTSGDLIVAVNGTAVRNAAEFERLLVDAQKKDTIELELLDTAGQRSRLTTKWGR
jgi:serine protease Do